MSFAFRFGEPRDIPAVAKLLADCGLPSADIDGHIGHFVLAPAGDTLAGAVGLEICGTTALLRSLAVAERFGGQGLASRLYDRIVAHAHANDVTALFLLTSTAGRFFRRRGFQAASRASAPPAIAATREFAALCPDSAEFLVKDLRNDARYFPAGSLPMRPDVPGASLWSVALRDTMLTYFEIEPHARFERHHHEGEQITLVLQGQLTFALDDRLVKVRAGEVVAVPARVSHAVYAGEEPVRAVDAWSPVPDAWRKAALEEQR